MFRKSPHEHELLSAYLDGQVLPAERQRIEEHLAECQECADELESLRRVVLALRSCPTVQPTRSFVLTEAEVQPRRAWSPLTRLSSYVTVVAAALLVLVLFVDVAVLSPAEERRELTSSAPVAGYMADYAGPNSHSTSETSAAEPTSIALLAVPLAEQDSTAQTAPPGEALEKAAGVAAAPTVPAAELTVPAPEVGAAEALAAEAEEPVAEPPAGGETLARSALGAAPQATVAPTTIAADTGGPASAETAAAEPEARAGQPGPDSTAVEPRSELAPAPAPLAVEPAHPWWFWALRAIEVMLAAALLASAVTWWRRDRAR